MLSHKLLGAAKSVAAITYVGGTTAAITASTSTTTNVSLTSLSGGIASAPVEGDLVVVYYGTGSTADRAISVTTSGYTQVAKLYANRTRDANLYVGYKVMTSSPDTQVTVSATLGTSEAGAVAVQVWRNVDTILPLDKAAVTATGIATVLCNPAAITPNTTGSIIVAGGAGAHNAAGNPTFSSSNLSNFLTIGNSSGSNYSTVGLGSYTWTSGAFDPAAFTFSTTDDNGNTWAAVTLALRPKYTGTIPEFVASASTQNSTTGSSLVINKPTGTAQGDLMVAVMAASAGASAWTGDTDWTEIADQGGSAPVLRIAYKVAGASEGSSYTFTNGNASRKLAGSILTYRYAAYDTIAGSFTTGADPLVLTEVTTAADFSILIATGARSSVSITLGTPTNMTARVTDNDAEAPSYIICDQYAFSGATGTRSMSMGSTTSVAGIMLSIKPS